MNSLNIRQKLFFVFGILIVIFAANGLFTCYSMNSINDGAMRIVTKLMPNVTAGTKTMQTLAEYQRGEYAIVMSTGLSSRIYAVQETRKLGDQIDIALKTMAPNISKKDADIFQELCTNWESYKKVLAKVTTFAKSGQPTEAVKEIEAAQIQYDLISANLNLVVDSEKDFIHAESNNASAKYEQTKWTLIICIFAVILISIFIAFYLSSNMMKSIRQLMHISNELADGNLSVEAVAQTKDEFGQLTEAYGKTVNNLRTLIRHIQDTANEVSSFAAQLMENAEQSAQATQQVAGSITNVAASSHQQVDSVGRSLTDIQDMSQSLHGFEEKASASADAAKNVEKIAADGKASIAGAVKQMAEIADSVTDSANVIKKLAERSTEIGQISDTISGIAEQTNLLSLNAAIEAARAGEAGRGFSVVAEEVRKLAEESATAAQKIASLIRTIQEDTAQAVARMEKGTSDVQSGQEVVTNAGKSFDTIATAITNLTQHSNNILSEARSSSANATQLVDVMKNINQSSYDVASEAESVSAATEQQSASMDEVATASKKLADLASVLTDSTAKFKI